jgi:hypothetical protein
MANGTINRELAVLTKMLCLAYENRKLLRLPVFDRYHIVRPADLQDVARRLTGTISGTIVSESTYVRLTPAP